MSCDIEPVLPEGPVYRMARGPDPCSVLLVDIVLVVVEVMDIAARGGALAARLGGGGVLEVTATVRPTRAGRARRRRSDAGAIRATARDLALLRFTGEQYAVTVPQLARLMGRSEHAARWLRVALGAGGVGAGPGAAGRRAGVRVADAPRAAGCGAPVQGVAPEPRRARPHRGGERGSSARAGPASRGRVGVRARAGAGRPRRAGRLRRRTGRTPLW